MRALFAIPLLISGCAMASIMGESSSPWLEAGPSSLPAAEIVALTKDLILRQGYRLPPAAPGATRFLSEWDVRLSPHWREGYRTRVEAEVVRLDDRPGLFVRVRSQREVNNEAGKPTMPEHAQWISASLDEKQKTKIDEPALKLQQLLRFRLEAR